MRCTGTPAWKADRSIRALRKAVHCPRSRSAAGGTSVPGRADGRAPRSRISPPCGPRPSFGYGRRSSDLIKRVELMRSMQATGSTWSAMEHTRSASRPQEPTQQTDQLSVVRFGRACCRAGFEPAILVPSGRPAQPQRPARRVRLQPGGASAASICAARSGGRPVTMSSAMSSPAAGLIMIPVPPKCVAR